MIYILVIITIIILFWSKYLFKKPHPFWDTQNVSRKYQVIGRISKNKPTPLKLSRDIKKDFISPSLVDSYKVKQLLLFLNTHYIKGFQYSQAFLEWSLYNTAILMFQHKKTIIGSITNHDMLICINQTSYPFGYVDYLCVNSTYRNRYIAPQLISHLISMYPSSYYFVFKKDDNPLPFDYLCKFNYHLLDLSQHKILNNSNRYHFMHKSDLEESYKIFKRYSKQFVFSIEFTYKQFCDIYFPKKNVLYTFIDKQNGNILNIFSFYLSKIFYLGKIYYIAEILFMISKNNEYYTNLEFIIKYCQVLNIDYLSVSDMNGLNTLLKKGDFQKGKNSYLQLYNFGFKHTLSPQQIFFPLP